MRARGLNNINAIANDLTRYLHEGLRVVQRVHQTSNWAARS